MQRALRVAAPLIVIVGLAGAIVGIVAGQSAALVAVDAMGALVGILIMLMLRLIR